MLWIKALHIIFLVTWFAGLFYLPRLFVYHAVTTDEISHERFLVMERKLYIIMSIGAVLTAIFGIWMLAATVIAVRQALDYNSTWRAVAVCLIGWLVQAIIFSLTFAITGALHRKPTMVCNILGTS